MRSLRSGEPTSANGADIISDIADRNRGPFAFVDVVSHGRFRRKAVDGPLNHLVGDGLGLGCVKSILRIGRAQDRFEQTSAGA